MAKNLRKICVRYIQLLENDDSGDFIGTLLSTNESILAAIALYDRMSKPTDLDSDDEPADESRYAGGLKPQDDDVASIRSRLSAFDVRESEVDKLQERQRLRVAQSNRDRAIRETTVHPDLLDLNFTARYARTVIPHNRTDDSSAPQPPAAHPSRAARSLAPSQNTRTRRPRRPPPSMKSSTTVTAVQQPLRAKGTSPTRSTSTTVIPSTGTARDCWKREETRTRSATMRGRRVCMRWARRVLSRSGWSGRRCDSIGLSRCASVMSSVQSPPHVLDCCRVRSAAGLETRAESQSAATAADPALNARPCGTNIRPSQRGENALQASPTLSPARRTGEKFSGAQLRRCACGAALRGSSQPNMHISRSSPDQRIRRHQRTKGNCLRSLRNCLPFSSPAPSSMAALLVSALLLAAPATAYYNQYQICNTTLPQYPTGYYDSYSPSNSEDPRAVFRGLLANCDVRGPNCTTLALESRSKGQLDGYLYPNAFATGGVSTAVTTFVPYGLALRQYVD